MVLGVSAEATAAILGALAGGGIAILGQALFGVVGVLRARRVAAQMIFAELVGNMSNARVAVEVDGVGWPSTQPHAVRTAWDTYGARLLLPWHRVHHLGAIATAYNRVDDIAWLAVEENFDSAKDYSHWINDIYAGMYVAGRAGGYSEAELLDRKLPVEQVRADLEELAARARASRRASRIAGFVRFVRRTRSFL